MTSHAPPLGPVARLFWFVVDTVRSPIVFDGTARLCDSSHALFIDPAAVDPLGPLHIDLEGKFHNRGGQTTTVIGIQGKVSGHELAPEDFAEVTLEPGGPRADVSSELYLAAGDEFEFSADAGEKLTLKLRVTRGGARAPRVKLRLKPQSA